MVIHVDDLFITRKSEDNHITFEACMRGKYKEIKISKRKVVNYIGMTFDYIVPGQVSINWTIASAPSYMNAGCGR